MQDGNCTGMNVLLERWFSVRASGSTVGAEVIGGATTFAKLLSGRWRECPLLVHVFAALFIFEYIFLR